MPNTLPWFSCTLPSCNDQSADKDLHVPLSRVFIS